MLIGMYCLSANIPLSYGCEKQSLVIPKFRERGGCSLIYLIAVCGSEWHEIFDRLYAYKALNELIKRLRLAFWMVDLGLLGEHGFGRSSTRIFPASTKLNTLITGKVKSRK